MKEETVEETVQRLSNFLLGNFAMEDVKISDELRLETEQKIRKYVEEERKNKEEEAEGTEIA